MSARTSAGVSARPGRRATVVNGLLLLAVLLLVAAPLVLRGDSPFGGADARAEEVVLADDPGFEPVAQPLFEAPSAEVESGLFALQAAAGAGVLGYCLGVLRTRHQARTASVVSLPGPVSLPGSVD